MACHFESVVNPSLTGLWKGFPLFARNAGSWISPPAPGLGDWQQLKPAVFTVAKLLGTQGFHRIHRSGAPCRNKSGKGSNQTNDHDASSITARIGYGNA